MSMCLRIVTIVLPLLQVSLCYQLSDSALIDEKANMNRFMRTEGQTAGTSNCELPAFGRWCTAKSGGKEWQMAVYSGTDVVSDTICKTGFWEFSDPKAWGLSDPAAGAQLLDIGANVGWYSLMAAQHGYNVLAVEPMTGNRALLKASICANPELAPKIQIVAAALTDKATPGSMCKIFSADYNKGDGSIACGEAQIEDQAKTHTARESVPMTTLDEVLQTAGVPQIDVVKMDVERYECVVLRGGSQLFSKFHPKQLMIEAHVSPEEAGNDLADTVSCVVKDAMAGGSYRLHDKSFSGGVINPPTDKGTFNLFLNSA